MHMLPRPAHTCWTCIAFTAYRRQTCPHIRNVSFSQLTDGKPAHTLEMYSFHSLQTADLPIHWICILFSAYRQQTCVLFTAQPQLTYTNKDDDLVAVDEDLVDGFWKLDGVGGLVHGHHSVWQSIAPAAHRPRQPIKVGQGRDGPVVKNPLFVTCYHLPTVNWQLQCTVNPGWSSILKCFMSISAWKHVTLIHGCLMTQKPTNLLICN